MTNLRLAALMALATLGVATTAQAAWEAPKRVDQTGEVFGPSSAGDIATGFNGLTSLLFVQSTDTGTNIYQSRRAAGAGSWATPAAVAIEATPAKGTFKTPLDLLAARSGDAAGAFRFEQPQEPVPPSPESNYAVGVGWPAGGNAGAKLLQRQSGASTPQAEVDGKGNGYVAAITQDAPPGVPDPSNPGEPTPPTPDDARPVKLQVLQFPLASRDRTELQGPTGDDLAPQYSPPTTPPGSAPDGPEDFPDPRTGSERPIKPPSNPQIAVNEDGDIGVSFVAQPNPSTQQQPKKAIFVVRLLAGANAKFSEPMQISQKAELGDVTEHDIAIAEDGTISVAFAADPTRDDADRIFLRRWLPDAGVPRAESTIEFVSSSSASAPDASSPKLVVDPAGNLTAAWAEGGNSLLSAERTSSWTAPQRLSTAAGDFDLAVDEAGAATTVYRESGAIRARRRSSGTQWGDADTISSAPIDATVAPQVSAGKQLQADAFFIQNDGSRKAAFANRFIGSPPVTPPAIVLPPTDGCPADINIVGGTDGNDTLTGTAAADTVLGGNGSDTMSGGAGNDCLRGQAGNDQVHGNDGNDNADGGVGDDNVTGGEGRDAVSGGAGNDTVVGDAEQDAVTGGDGNDELDGGAGDDVVSGDGGDDKVRGGVGDDRLGGGVGDDQIFAQEGKNTAFGGAGNDSLVGGSNADSLFGEAGNDRLSGGSGVGKLDGGSGHDRLTGGNQNDQLRGGTGRDVLVGASGHDLLKGGNDADSLGGNSGRDRIYGEKGKDRLRGGNANDRLFGGDSADVLSGDGGNDILSGGAGNDILNGGTGRDRLSGGSGDDRISAVDGKKDTITCGAGKKDSVTADRIDRVGRSCERVKRARTRRTRGS